MHGGRGEGEQGVYVAVRGDAGPLGGHLEHLCLLLLADFAVHHTLDGEQHFTRNLNNDDVIWVPIRNLIKTNKTGTGTCKFGAISKAKKAQSF